MMHYTGNLFKDSVCLEMGSGWVLSHAVVAYLLGAKKIYASDYFPLADFAALKISISKSDAALIRDILAPYEDHEILREKVEQLRAISRWNSEELEHIGITYTAPVDFVREMPFDDVDFIYSLSVLEHIPCDSVTALLRQLSGIPTQFHFIHLEDHADLANEPFEFLTFSHYPKQLQLERGNRIRASQWIELLSKYHTVEVVHAWKRNMPIPDSLASEIEFVDEDDIRTSHLGLLLRQ